MNTIAGTISMFVCFSVVYWCFFFKGGDGLVRELLRDLAKHFRGPVTHMSDIKGKYFQSSLLDH